jgi:hypothetical protein
MSRRKVDHDFRERMNRLHQNIVRTYLCGIIDPSAYQFSMNILARMIKQNSDQISVVIDDTWRTLIMRGQTWVCGTNGYTDLFELYVHGALQQCQSKFGIAIERSPEALRTLVAEAEAVDEMPVNFTALPGDGNGDWNYVTPGMVLHCQLVDRSCGDWQEAITDIVVPLSKQALFLPRWLTTVEI